MADTPRVPPRFGVGETDAFHVLYVEHLPMLVSFLSGLVGSRELGEDLAQDTFVRARSILASWDDSKPFAAWLRAIGRNIARESYRHRHRSPLAMSEQLLTALDSRYENLDSAPGDDFTEKVGFLRTCMRKLPELLRMAVALCYTDGLSCHEAAARTGTSAEAVKKRIQRARRALATCIRHSLEARS